MVKKLLAHIGEYKKNSILAPLFMVGEVAMDVSIPYLMSFLIDKGLNKGDLDYVLKMGALMLVMVVIGLICGSLSGTHAAIASAGLAKNLRKALYRNVQDFSFENIDKYSSSSLITRLTTDVTNVQNSYQMIIRTLVRAPLMLIFALIMSFMLNAKLACTFLVAVPILAGALLFMIKAAKKFFELLFKEYDKLNNDVQENLLNIRTVKAYVREEREIHKFNAISSNLFNYSKNAEKLMVLLDPVMYLVIYGVTIAVSIFGGRLIVGGEMSTGDLTSYFTYVMQVMMSLIMISMISVMVVMSMASARRIAEVLDEKSTIVNPENPVMEVKDGSIDFEHVSFSYVKDEEKDVLEDINFHIESGQTIGIIGGTGSSKSTLVSLIPRLYDVTKGSVKVGGVDVRDLDLYTLRESVSMVLQKNELFSGTISDNMRWGDLNATDAQIKEACELAQADEFIHELEGNYDYKIEQGGNNVSGGQKQRLCIARALLKNPKILILDDSTSAVDMKTDALIRDAFTNKIPNTTKIIIAQRIASIEDADQIIVMDEGKIAGIGTHEELYQNNEIYKEVYDSQVKGGDDDAA